MTVFESLGLFFVILMTLLGTATVAFCAWEGFQHLRSERAEGKRRTVVA